MRLIRTIVEKQRARRAESSSSSCCSHIEPEEKRQESAPPQDTTTTTTTTTISSSCTPSTSPPLSLIQQIEQAGSGILAQRPDRISMTVTRFDSSESWGCTFCRQKNPDTQNNVVDRILVDKGGLLVVPNVYLGVETILKPGDVLEAINGYSCEGVFLGDIMYYLDELVGQVTFVFKTNNNNNNNHTNHSQHHPLRLCQCLCQTVLVQRLPPPPHSFLELQTIGPYIQLASVTPHGWIDSDNHNKSQQDAKDNSGVLLLEEGDFLIAINANPCLTLDLDSANMLLDHLLGSNHHPHPHHIHNYYHRVFSITTLRRKKEKRWVRILRRSVVSVCGGTMVVGGAVVMATPLHPIGHAMAVGGIGVLGTEFEAPKAAIKYAGERIQQHLGGVGATNDIATTTTTISSSGSSGGSSSSSTTTKKSCTSCDQEAVVLAAAAAAAAAESSSLPTTQTSAAAAVQEETMVFSKVEESERERHPA